MSPNPASRTQQTNHRNHVQLLGELTAPAAHRTLRNGMIIVTWRLLVHRVLVQPGGPSSDTIDCLSMAPATRRSAPTWQVGDLISCEGALRRRFWRSGPGTISRCEVEVNRARRVSRTRASPADEPLDAAGQPPVEESS